MPRDQTSWVDGHQVESRLDSEYYSPDALRDAAWIHSGIIPTKRLESLTVLLTDGVHASPEFTEEGPLYLSATNILPFHFDPERNYRHISEATFLAHARGNCAPEAGDVLLAKSGRIGAAAIVPPGLRFSVLHSAAILRVGDQVDAEWLCAFLNSPPGRAQIWRFQKGTAQPMLHLEEIAEIRVPTPEKTERDAITDAVRAAMECRRRSRKHQEAVDKWIWRTACGAQLATQSVAFLEHSPSATIRDATWTSQVPTADRIDPWPFHIAPRTIRSHLEKQECAVRFGRVAQRVTSRRGRTNFSDGEAGFYISVLDLDMQGRIDWKRASSSRYEAPGLAVEPGDLLFSCINPRQPRVAWVPEDISGKILCSPEFAILRCRTDLFGHPALLAAVLRSGWVRVQTSFRTRSSSLSRRRIDERDLEEVIVPWSVADVEDMEATARLSLLEERRAEAVLATVSDAMARLTIGAFERPQFEKTIGEALGESVSADNAE